MFVRQTVVAGVTGLGKSNRQDVDVLLRLQVKVWWCTCKLLTIGYMGSLGSGKAAELGSGKAADMKLSMNFAACCLPVNVSMFGEFAIQKKACT
jgi:hypothetical protein